MPTFGVVSCCLVLCRVDVDVDVDVDGKLGDMTEQAYEVPRMLWQRSTDLAYMYMLLAMQLPLQRQRQAAVP